MRTAMHTDRFCKYPYRSCYFGWSQKQRNETWWKWTCVIIITGFQWSVCSYLGSYHNMLPIALVSSLKTVHAFRRWFRSPSTSNIRAKRGRKRRLLMRSESRGELARNSGSLEALTRPWLHAVESSDSTLYQGTHKCRINWRPPKTDECANESCTAVAANRSWWLSVEISSTRSCRLDWILPVINGECIESWRPYSGCRQ